MPEVTEKKLSEVLNEIDSIIEIPRREGGHIDKRDVDRLGDLEADADRTIAGSENVPASLLTQRREQITWLTSIAVPTREDEAAAERVLGYPNPRRQNTPYGFAVHQQRGSGSGMSFRNQATGQIVRALSHNESLASSMDGYNRYDAAPACCDIGELICGMATGRMSEPAKLAVIGNSGTAGGYLLNPQMSANVIDLARAASVCMRAGAQTIPMETSELILARLNTDPTSHWRAEGVSVTASEPVFGKITLRAKTLACLIPCSIELLEDSSNASQIITGAVQKSMGAEIDRVILKGSGAASEPVGIRSTTGVNTTTSVGLPADYVEATAAVTDILTANYPHEVSELCWLQHPSVAAIYDGLSDNTAANARVMPPWAAAMKRLYSTNLPNLEGAGSDEYSDIFGYFPSVLVGLRTSGMVVEVLNSGTATDADSNTPNAASDLLRFIRCYCRLDVAVMQPTWFNVASGITLV